MLPNPPFPVRIPKYQGECDSPAFDPNKDGWSKRRPDYTVPYDLPDAEKHHRLAEVALKSYNKKNGTSYELLKVILSNGFLSDGP